MKRFAVRMPCTMSLYMEVEAETKEDAKEAAYALNFGVVTKAADEAAEDAELYIEEFEMHDYVTRGNVFYGVLNEIDIEELEGDDDGE